MFTSAKAVAAVAVTVFLCGFMAGAITRPAGAIYNGENAQISEFPFMVSVQRYNPSTNEWFTATPGAHFVSANWILTAAHCVYNDGVGPLLASDLRVVVGRDKQLGDWSDFDRRQVGAPVFYPAANGSPLYANDSYQGHTGDIALLPLETPVNGVSPVQLTFAELAVGTAVTAAGWGTAAAEWNNRQPPDQLQKLDDVRIKADSDCWDSPEAAVSAVQICSKENDSPTVIQVGGPRQGDSGGPLLYWTGSGWIQIGIASHLPRKDDPSFFGIGSGR